MQKIKNYWEPTDITIGPYGPFDSVPLLEDFIVPTLLDLIVIGYFHENKGSVAGIIQNNGRIFPIRQHNHNKERDGSQDMAIKYCKEIWSTKEGLKQCKKCDFRAMKRFTVEDSWSSAGETDNEWTETYPEKIETLSQGKITCYKCHGGLVELIIPVALNINDKGGNQMTIAALWAGQHKVDKHAFSDDEVRAIGKKIGHSNPDKLVTIYNEIKLTNVQLINGRRKTLEKVVPPIEDTASVIFQAQKAKERRDKALGRMTHELRVPIVAIKGAIEFIIDTPGSKDFFNQDYPGDIESWTELMTRVVDNADVYRYADKGELEIRPEKVFLLTNVIAPAIRQVRLLLKARDFSPRNITYIGFENFPVLWLDRNRFQQIIFNLLSNSIKYAYDDPENFEVEIEGTEKGSYFYIYIRDWGTGIEETTEMEEVFEEEFRGSKAVDMNVTGQGLGLWVVKQIIEKHEGEIRVSKSHLPTEIEIKLPYWLTSRPPK